MRGVSAMTGRALSGREHLRQSIRDILTTPLGSRVMRRDYGSRIFDLIDGPLTRGHVAAIIAASAEALDRWEPRFRVRRIRVFAAGEGHVAIDVDGEDLERGGPLGLAGILV